MNALPFELYRQILESIHTRRTLLTLCLASRALRAEAERILYDHPNRYFRRPNAQTTFLSHIAHCERHARLVRKISIYIYIEPPHDPLLGSYITSRDILAWRAGVASRTRRLDDDWEKSAWNWYIPPLNALVHLRHLVITVGPTDAHTNRYTRRTFGHIFDQTVFQLHSLVCTFKVDSKISEFVGRQRELRYLEWNYPPIEPVPVLQPPWGGTPAIAFASPPQNQHGVLPRLAYLSSDIGLVRNMIEIGRGRTLCALQVDANFLMGTLPELTGLEILSVWAQPFTLVWLIYDFLAKQATFIPNLKKLECMIGRLEDEYSLIQALCALPKLEVLKLRSTLSTQNYRDAELMSLLLRIFESTALRASIRAADQSPRQPISPEPSLKKINLSLATDMVTNTHRSSNTQKVLFEGWTFDRVTGKRNPKKEEVGWHSWAREAVSDVS